MSLQFSDNDLGCIMPDGPTRSLQRRGALEGRNMYWSADGPLNFGDWIGPYIYKKISGLAPHHCRVWRTNPPDHIFFSAGSIFRKIKKDDVAIVWGSGSLSRKVNVARPRKSHAVRGPLSQEILDRLGYEVPDCIGDPGLCLPKFYMPKIEKQFRLGIIPHLVDLEFWRSKKLPEYTTVISLNNNIEPVVNQVLSCEVTISSSLHGLIVSHAYGVPSVWMRPATGRLVGDDTKFIDYFLSVGLDVRPSDALIVTELQSAQDIQRLASLPTSDISSMAENLLSVCPFPKHELISRSDDLGPS